MEKLLSGILLKEKWRIVISLLAFLAAGMVMFEGLRLYSILHDEAYMGVCCKNYENSPLAMMLFFVGNGWMSIFGDTLISLRVLCRLCILAAIGIGSIYLWQQTHNILLTSVVVLFVAITANLGDISFYNWDTGAYPVAAMGALFLLIYVDKSSVRNIILLSVFGGIMTASRIPLIAFSVIILIAIIGVKKNKEVYYHTLIAAISFVLSWVGCGILMVGSLGAYIYSFRSENIITGHSLNDITCYVDNIMMLLPRMVLFMMPATVGCLFGVLLGFKDKLSVKVFLCCEIILFAIVLMLSLTYIGNIASFVNEVGLPVFLITLFWIGIARTIGYQDSWIIQNRQKLKLGLLLMVILLLGFGSDMFFNKWTIIFLLPMSLGVIWPGLNSNSKRVFKLIFVILVPVLLMWVPIKERCIESTCIELSGLKRMTGLKMSEYKGGPINSLNEYIGKNNLEGDSIAFIGGPLRYIYTYEFGESSEASSFLHYYHWNDSRNEAITHISGKVPVVIVVGKAPNSVKFLVENNYQVDSEHPEYTVLKLR